MIDSSLFEDIWNKSSQDNLQDTQNFWNHRAEEFNCVGADKKKDKEKLVLIEFLISKGFIDENSNVLDIGCGPGKYAVEFAKRACSVTGTDISPEMLKYAKQNAELQKLNNVKFLNSPWQTLDIDKLSWNKKFDLVFASMTPAINSADALLKMMKASKKHCFMSGFVYRKDSLRDEIYKKLNFHNKNRISSIYCAFNILWNMKIYPEITYKNSKWEKEWTVDKAVELHTLQLLKGGKLDESKKAEIRKYIEDKSENGIVKSAVDAKIAWMTWEI